MSLMSFRASFQDACLEVSSSNCPENLIRLSVRIATRNKTASVWMSSQYLEPEAKGSPSLWTYTKHSRKGATETHSMFTGLLVILVVVVRGLSSFVELQLSLRVSKLMGIFCGLVLG